MSLRPYLLSALLGAASVAGFAPPGWWPLPILALALLFRWGRADSVTVAFLRGWAFGLGLFLAGVSWVYVSLSLYGGLPVPLAALATLLFCAFMALYPALALALAARLAPAGRARQVLALPAAWVLLEWARSWFLTGFPWLALGYSQAPTSPLAGYAPVLGVVGVSLMAALAAGALAALLPPPGGEGGGEGGACKAPCGRHPLLTAASLRPPSPVGGGVGLLLIFLLGWGLQQAAWTRPVGAPVNVALLQGNVAQDMKFNPERLVPTLRSYAEMVQATKARLIVLPETALPLLRSAVPPDYLGALGVHAAKNGGDVVIGLPEDVGTGAYYNSAISLGASPEGGYRKHHLVAFGEFVPFGFRWLVDRMHIPLGDFTPGEPTQPAIAAAGQRLAVNICYEDAFGEERIHAAREATLLVNISNDAWFGASLAPAQHLQIGAMRSLEAGRWQLRANNTGVTAILDHAGRVQAQLPPFTRATLEGQAQGREGLTPFLRWGNIPALILSMLLLAASFVLTGMTLKRKPRA